MIAGLGYKIYSCGNLIIFIVKKESSAERSGVGFLSRDGIAGRYSHFRACADHILKL